jgi:endonuclease/exonuclease/phosphatase family metal-dependent hydrolase
VEPGERRGETDLLSASSNDWQEASDRGPGTLESLKVLTWNLNGRAPAKTWDYIDRSLGADVMFVQEAAPINEQGFGPDQWLWTEIGENSRFEDAGKYRWASGIRVRSGSLSTIDTKSLGPGWVVGATYEGAKRPITLINVHIQLFPGERYATTTLEDTIAALEGPLSSQDVIFGGDLNVDRLMDDVYDTQRHGKALDRLETLGLFHVNSLLPKGTRTWRKGKHPYQDDHFFVSESLKESIEDVRVVVGSRTAALSDHYPLMLELHL